ncbi:outer membrane protein [Francisella hispaniensis]|uniref:Outer membrane protein beta-barrel domain-containing protein n=1 Tax=Francisella hispaniensis TaxID=622488 RepID=F4BJG5_9GAMM|nr:outer membrane beta-barrel protein [Francisella hispaniensis]AEB28309.1 hypothetical protein FN3523_0452 [Francisella hispaniensis]
MIIKKFFLYILGFALLFTFVFTNANTASNLEKDTNDLYNLPKNYYTTNHLDHITKKIFKPSLYIAINGGWGQQTNMSKGGGTVVANLGYRFSQSYAIEFVYQNFLVSQYNTTQVNNYFAGAAKYYYKINDYVTAYAAAGLGIGHTNINGIANQQNAPNSYLATNNTWGGFAVFPVGIMFPIKYMDNLSLKVTYTYSISFSGNSQNFVTSGLQYSF